jgi:GNAT superfamily N-acetyltransferase
MLEFKPLEVAPPDIQNYADLFKAVFNEPEVLTTKFLDWLYAKNPVGNAFGLNAWSDGELAAHYAAIPVVYLINGVKTKGLLALNTATHPKHQGKGIFTKIGNAANELAASRGYEFVSGVANQNSTDGYLRKLGFLPYLAARGEGRDRLCADGDRRRPA